MVSFVPHTAAVTGRLSRVREATAVQCTIAAPRVPLDRGKPRGFVPIGTLAKRHWRPPTSAWKFQAAGLWRSNVNRNSGVYSIEAAVSLPQLEGGTRMTNVPSRQPA